MVYNITNQDPCVPVFMYTNKPFMFIKTAFEKGLHLWHMVFTSIVSKIKLKRVFKKGKWGIDNIDRLRATLTPQNIN